MYAEIFSPEILGILAVAVILLFGSSKLPQLAKSIGLAKKELREGMADDPVVEPAKTAAELPAPSTVIEGHPEPSEN